LDKNEQLRNLKDRLFSYVGNDLFFRKGVDFNPYLRDYDFLYGDNLVLFDIDDTVTYGLSLTDNYFIKLNEVAGIDVDEYGELAKKITEISQDQGRHYITEKDKREKTVFTRIRSKNRESFGKLLYKLIKKLESDNVTIFDHIRACELAVIDTAIAPYTLEAFMDIENMYYKIGFISAAPEPAASLFGETKLQILGKRTTASKFFSEDHLINDIDLCLDQNRRLDAEKILDLYTPGFKSVILTDDDLRSGMYTVSHSKVHLIADVGNEKTRLDSDEIKEIKLLGKVYAYLPKIREDMREYVKYLRKCERLRVLIFWKSPRVIYKICLGMKDIQRLADSIDKSDEIKGSDVEIFKEKSKSEVSYYRPVFPEESSGIVEYIDRLNPSLDSREVKDLVKTINNLFKELTATYHAPQDFIEGLLPFAKEFEPYKEEDWVKVNGRF